MTPEPVILPFTATVAEALAVVRDADLPVELAAQVFVVQPPTSTPTGRYLGLVPFQRLLREAPATTLEHCVFGEPEPVAPDLPLPRRRRAPGRLRRPRRAGVRRGPAARRRGHRRRRARPRAARRLAAREPAVTAAVMVRRREDLSRARGEGFRIGVHYDPDAFGRFSEAIARFLGTGRFLVGQTILVAVWITINVVAVQLPLGPVPVHPAEPGLLDPGRLRRAADPAGPEPPGRPRPRPGRDRPRGERPHPGRHRVPGPRARLGAPRARPTSSPPRTSATRSTRSPAPSTGCTSGSTASSAGPTAPS